MDKVKLINKKTKVIKEVPENLVDDYLGTNEFEIFKEVKTFEEERPFKNNNHKKVINVRGYK